MSQARSPQRARPRGTGAGPATPGKVERMTRAAMGDGGDGLRRLSIGDLAAASGVKAKTIRYYEAVGLLPAPERTTGGQRAYEPAHLRRLAFVRRARDLGFRMEDVRDLLRLADASPDTPCADIEAVARRQLAGIEARIERLHSLAAELHRMAGKSNDPGLAGADGGRHVVISSDEPAQREETGG